MIPISCHIPSPSDDDGVNILDCGGKILRRRGCWSQVVNNHPRYRIEAVASSSLNTYFMKNMAHNILICNYKLRTIAC